MTKRKRSESDEGDDVEEASPTNNLTVHAEEGEVPAKTVARFAASPTVRGAWTSKQYVSNLFDADITALVERLSVQGKAVQGGDLSSVEAMLAIQAHTLDAMFNQLAMRAASATYLPSQEALLRLALKAQAQCASTAKVLGEIKNPRAVAFIGQQNNAAGHQQINNGTAATPSADPRARAEECGRSNELLESKNGEWMDPGTPGKAGRSDQTLEAMGAINRADQRRG